jgi:RloB-like protein
VTGASRGGRPKRRVPSERSDVNRAQLLVFVEGLRTEVQYINFWYRMNRAQVLVDIDERHGTPMTLVKAALDAKWTEQREERKNRGKAHDEYWRVFDRDEHPQFDEAIKLARENGIGIAMSNPCLELWFVWHFADHTAHVERDVMQRCAAAHLGCGKSLTDAALEKLAESGRYDAAKKRALGMDARHEGDGSSPGSNPSSAIHVLIDRIRRTDGA